MRIGVSAGDGQLASDDPAGVTVVKTCEALARLGHDVVLFAQAGPGADPYDYYGIEPSFHVEWCRWPDLPRLKRFAIGRRLSRRIRAAGRFDLVIARTAHAVWWLQRLDVRPLILEVHQLPENTFESRLLESIVKRKGTELVCTCDYEAEALLRRYPRASADRVHVVRTGADPAEFLLARDPPEGCGQTERFQVGYVGECKPWKGAEIVVEVARRLPSMDVHVVGSTRKWRPADPPPNLRLHGQVGAGAIAPYLAAMDCLLLPPQPWWETGAPRSFPMKVFQYMASGKPIVASDHPMLREVLDEERAVLVPPGDVEAWVVAVSDLSADPDKCAGLGAAARREFEMKYTWRHRAERLLALVT